MEIQKINRKQRLLSAIKMTTGLSLNKLSEAVGLPYVTAYRYLSQLEIDGAVEVERSGKGSKLKIKTKEN